MCLRARAAFENAHSTHYQSRAPIPALPLVRLDSSARVLEQADRPRTKNYYSYSALDNEDIVSLTVSSASSLTNEGRFSAWTVDGH